MYNTRCLNRCPTTQDYIDFRRYRGQQYTIPVYYDRGIPISITITYLQFRAPLCTTITTQSTENYCTCIFYSFERRYHVYVFLFSPYCWFDGPLDGSHFLLSSSLPKLYVKVNVVTYFYVDEMFHRFGISFQCIRERKKEIGKCIS